MKLGTQQPSKKKVPFSSRISMSGQLFIFYILPTAFISLMLRGSLMLTTNDESSKPSLCFINYLWEKTCSINDIVGDDRKSEDSRTRAGKLLC